MTRLDLSSEIIDEQGLPARGRLELVDARTPGLVLRITSGGSRTWAVRARRGDGSATRVSLGPYPALTVAAARRRALGLIVAIRAGGDPIGEKRVARAERAARAEELTVTAALAAWREHREGDVVRPWSARYAAEVGRLARREIIPVLGRQPLASTVRADWTSLVREKRSISPATASMLYRTIAAFLNYSEAQGWIPAPLLPRKGLATLAPMPPARERSLSDDELMAVWRASGREGVKARVLVRLLILTATRLREVAEIRAGEVDLSAARWSIPPARMKNRRSLTLPLGLLAIEELASVWPIPAPSPDAMILGRRLDGSSGFSGFARLKARLDLASGVTDWVFHDLRRTARSAMSRLGLPSSSAEAALGHVSHRSALERVYDRHDFREEAASASLAWQEHVAALISSARHQREG